jgi:hypothetical protein
MSITCKGLQQPEWAGGESKLSKVDKVTKHCSRNIL